MPTTYGESEVSPNIAIAAMPNITNVMVSIVNTKTGVGTKFLMFSPWG